MPAQRGGLKVRELCADEAHSCCAYGNLVLIYCRTEASAEWLQQAVSAIADIARAYPEGLGLIIVLDEAAKPPSERCRLAIQRSLSDLRAVVRGCALVVEGHGFMAAAKRSAITVINQAPSRPFPMHVVASVAAAFSLLARSLGRVLDERANSAGLESAALAMRGGAAGERVSHTG